MKRQEATSAGDRGKLKVSPTASLRIACWPAAIDPALQVADYCSWAIQRKWERGDARSYASIANKVKSEFDLFERGKVIYY